MTETSPTPTPVGMPQRDVNLLQGTPILTNESDTSPTPTPTTESDTQTVTRLRATLKYHTRKRNSLAIETEHLKQRSLAIEDMIKAIQYRRRHRAIRTLKIRYSE